MPRFDVTRSLRSALVTIVGSYLTAGPGKNKRPVSRDTGRGVRIHRGTVAVPRNCSDGYGEATVIAAPLRS